MDDMWSIQAWDRIKFFFPDNKDGSRIVVTTRLSNLACRLSNSYGLDMRFLDMDESWDLFSGIVFPGDDYASEMVEIGMKIVENCRGLPLSIVVVGGFLAKSKCKREYWEYIDENLTSFVNSDNDEHCLKILQLSYNQLPVHLKPCFLFMGVFEEDMEFSIFKLVVLWVVEGFLKPISGKDLEEVAKEYLNDLVDRNLIFVMKSYLDQDSCVKIHDLLRDLCSRQAKVEKFYNVVTHHSDYIPNNQRRIVVPQDMFEDEAIDVLRSMSLARSLICYGSEISMPPHHRLLRIYQAREPSMIDEDCYFLFNLRYLSAQSITCSKLNSSLHLLWSLQALNIQDVQGFNEPIEIWNLPQLRHVRVTQYMYVAAPVCNGQDDILLENLQTLGIVRNFKCSEEVVKKIPNMKILGLEYNDDEEESCLNNLDCLHKLKNLCCVSVIRRDRDVTDFMQKLTFPRSLEKIDLVSRHVHWEDMLGKIGSLPLLCSLNIVGGVFTTGVWETVEGQFPNLKLLELHRCLQWSKHVSRNLQALTKVRNFKCSEVMVKRIPNESNLWNRVCYLLVMRSKKVVSIILIASTNSSLSISFPIHIFTKVIPPFYIQSEIDISSAKLSISKLFYLGRQFA